MNDLYWITVFGHLSGILVVAMIISAALALISIILILTDVGNEDKASKSLRKILWHPLKIELITCAISIVGYVFTPSTKQLYIIYGVGAVVDYLTDSSNAKMPPDNTINTVNLILESLSKENDGNQKKKMIKSIRRQCKMLKTL